MMKGQGPGGLVSRFLGKEIPKWTPVDVHSFRFRFRFRFYSYIYTNDRELYGFVIDLPSSV